ncbi:MAG: transposase [Flavobacteriales bacterium]|nr:transposase [Flavobacteriales bacterium]
MDNMEHFPANYMLFHIVIATGGKINTISPEVRQQAEKCIGDIIEENGHTPVSVVCMPDHCHILLDLNPDLSLDDAIILIKKKSARWFDEHLSFPENYYWQDGYAAFTHGLPDTAELIEKLLQQEEYHKTHKFREEYIALLDKHQVDYDENELFEFRD